MRALTAADYFFKEEDSEIGWYFSRCHQLALDVSIFLDRVGVNHHMVWLRHAVPDTYLAPTPTEEVVEHTVWRFHVVLEIDGKVHDPWSCLPPLPRDEYLKTMFPHDEVVAYPGRYTCEQLSKQARDPMYSAG